MIIDEKDLKKMIKSSIKAGSINVVLPNVALPEEVIERVLKKFPCCINRRCITEKEQPGEYEIDVTFSDQAIEIMAINKQIKKLKNTRLDLM